MKDEIKEFIEFRIDEDGTYFYYNDKDNVEQWSYKLDDLKDYITNLQEKNERLKEDIEDISVSHFSLFKQYEDYKSRNEKAIDLLKEAGCYDEETKTFCDDIWEELPKLLNILNGDDE